MQERAEVRGRTLPYIMRMYPLFVLSVLLRVCSVWDARAVAAASRGGQQGPHISNLNLLLPPRTSHPVHYHLQGYNGCFTWTWDHHDILNVEVEYNGTDTYCSTSAILTSIAPYTGRRTTSVHATDSVTGRVLRCEVFIDKISRIQIFHHSLKLDLDGLATLRIRAFDAEDNVFSSLAGLQFMWQLSPMTQTGDLTHRLTHVPLKHTSLGDGEIDTQIELEQNGLCSDLYVVRGISAGQETVKAHFMEPESENLMHIITLTVAEAVSLDPPSPLYIIPGTHIQYTLRALRRNEIKSVCTSEPVTVIPLPSRHHRWSVDNSTVADIDSSTGVIVGQAFGSTVVTVEDIRLTGHQQTSTLHVVPPISLALYLSPLPLKGTGSLVSADQLLVSSDSSWQVVIGRKYVLQALSFSLESGTQPLLLTKDNDLTMPSANLPYWKISKVHEDVVAEQGWRNCSLLEALMEGNGRLVSTLGHSIMVQDETSGHWIETNRQVLTVEQEIMVCTQVTIKTSDNLDSLRLPWAPGRGQEYQLFAEGGCGKKLTDFIWSSSDPAVATISSVGVVQTKGLGRIVIRAAALGDSFNDDEISVEVSYPSAIDIVPGLPVEVEVGSFLPVAVGLRDPSGLGYSRCDVFGELVPWGIFGADGLFATVKDIGSILFPLRPSVSGERKVDTLISGQEEAMQLIHPHACAWTLISAAQPGRATVRASLNMGDLLAELITPEVEHPYLEASWTIAAFAPLTLEQASNGDAHGGYTHRVFSAGAAGSSANSPESERLRELLLVLRSSMNVIVRGGPDRWRQGVEFVDTYEVKFGAGLASKDAVTVSHMQEGGTRVYNIECKSLGNYTVTFYRGNLVGEDHPTKSVATVSLSVICAIPAAISLLVDEPENSLSLIKSAAQVECDASRRHVTPITVVNGRTIRVAAVAFHASGRPFANASSMNVRWDLVGCNDLADWEVKSSDSNIYLSGWELYLVLGHVTGECSVCAKLHGFSGESEGTSTIVSAVKALGKSDTQLVDIVPLQLVTALRLEPSVLLLFHHPDAKASLSVLGGTSDIEAHANDTKVAVVIPLDTRGLIVAARGSGTAVITINDVGLATPASACALVTVADVAWVRLLLPEDASLQVGSCMTVQLQGGDSYGHIFDASQFLFMNMKVHLQDEVLVTKSNDGTIAGDEIVICGATVGLATELHVSVEQHSGKEVLSDFARILVYAPLSIHPSSLVLAPGAKYVLVVYGGPQTGVSIQYFASNPDVAKIDSTTGLVEAKAPGQVTIQAQARSPGGELLSEDELSMTVQVPASMKLNVRGGQLAVGREITLFPYGQEENLFSFFELCRNYKWSVGDDQVLALQIADLGHAEASSASSSQVDRSRSTIQRGNEGTAHGFSARASGKSGGRTIVTLSFVCQFNYHGQKVQREYTPSGTVWVVPDPPLALGLATTWVLPPDYTSSPLLPQRTKNPARSDPGSSGRSVLYSVMHEGSNDANLLCILERGAIRTSEKAEVACIHARDRSTGRSEIAACIRVAEVASLTVGDDDLAVHVAELSVGTSQKLIVSLRDNLGAPFLEVGDVVPILLDTNRVDLISVKVAEYEKSSGLKNITIIIEALRQGTALVRVSYEGDSQIVDWILVNVGAYVSPRSPVVHIGSKFSFSIIGKGLHGLPAGERGSWLSANDSIVCVNSYTGDAQAIREGTTTVSFNGSRLTTYTIVTVIRVSSIHVEVPLGIITNVPTPEQGYLFPVIFSDSLGRDVGVVGENHEVSYSCRVEPSYIGEAKAWREPGGSVFHCVFLPYHPTKLRAAFLKWDPQKRKPLKEPHGKIEFTMIASVDGNPAVEGSTKAKFAGGFQIVDSLPAELHLSPKTREWVVSMIGNVHPDVVQLTTTGRPDALECRLQNPKSETAGVGGRAMYKVKTVEENKHFSENLIIKSSSSGQHMEIPVVYNAGRQSMAARLAQIITAFAIILLLLVLPLIFCARLLDLPRSASCTRSSEAGPLEEPTMNGGPDENTPIRQRNFGSPQFGSPQLSDILDSTPPASQVFGSKSPQQPFTEYISRTLESTPYYSREGYRKYDPSRTY